MAPIDEIRTYPFTKAGLDQVKDSQLGNNWPVVYLIHDDKNLYIGETTSASTRMSQHLDNDEKKDLEVIEIVFNGTYNKSVILDYEQKLIKYCSSDDRFERIINKNKGQNAEHDYYQRKEYREKFANLWKQLVAKGVAHKTIKSIENDKIFKFSPYNSLTAEQNAVCVDVLNEILDTFDNDLGTRASLVDGCAGTGKTVLAISMINSLINAINYEVEGEEFFVNEDDSYKNSTLLNIKDFIQKKRNGKPLKIGFVFPMSGIRNTISDVFKQCGNGLEAQMVIGPNDVLKADYDILFVDESHRLCRRKNLTGYKHFDDASIQLGLNPDETNQLEWILKSAKHVVLFYDKYQSVKSADIPHKDFEKALSELGSDNVKRHKLTTQMRCEGGDDYIQYIRNILTCKEKQFKKVNNYKFLLFDDVDDMVCKIRELDSKYGLCRTVAGYSWEWKTKSVYTKNDLERYDYLVKTGSYDILIENYKYIWNISDKNWVNREDARYTIGCIHTTQGFDMNYAGVILGEEIDYNPTTNQIEIRIDKFKDKKVKAATDEEDLKEIILNTYMTILARGIKGCFVYACNKELREYLKRFIAEANEETLKDM